MLGSPSGCKPQRGLAWLGSVGLGKVGHGRARCGRAAIAARRGQPFPAAFIGSYGKARHGTAWRGMAGHGMAGHGTVRQGLISALGASAPTAGFFGIQSGFGRARQGRARRGTAGQGRARRGTAGQGQRRPSGSPRVRSPGAVSPFWGAWQSRAGRGSARCGLARRGMARSGMGCQMTAALGAPAPTAVLIRGQLR